MVTRTCSRSPGPRSLLPGLYGAQDALAEATKRVARAHAENEKETRERLVEEAKQTRKRAFEEGQEELAKKTQRISELEAKVSALEAELSAERAEHAALRETEAAARLILFPADAFNSGAAGLEAHYPPQGQDGRVPPAGLVAVEDELTVADDASPAAPPAGSSGPATTPAVDYAASFRENEGNPSAQADVLALALMTRISTNPEKKLHEFAIVDAYKILVRGGDSRDTLYQKVRTRLQEDLCPSTRNGWQFRWIKQKKLIEVQRAE